MPVTEPVVFTLATVILLLVQLPSGRLAVNVVADPVHILALPDTVAAEGAGSTDTVVAVPAVPHAFVTM
jgi:hypothetical protein